MQDVMEIGEVMSQLDQWQIVDVRSPTEFQDGHIPGAISLPLFTDEERAKVGTLYKQASPEAAMDAGLSIAGGKMKSLVRQGRALAENSGKPLLIHCWRGGNRSKAMTWLFRFSGINACRLNGGYKSFRTALQAFFANNDFELNIIGGCTGAGKTEVLGQLRSANEQVIDLEQLAHHKGSAFGAIGEPEQPTNEQFENDLYLEFLRMDPGRPVWIENESKNIGKTYMPESLWEKIRTSTLFAIEVSEDTRIDRVLRYYCEPVDTDALKDAFDRIRKRLGGLAHQQAIKALDQHDLRTAALIALRYYDKSYRFQLEDWPSGKVVQLEECNDVKATADRLIAAYGKLTGSTHVKNFVKS
jgi:tRNA 2-selenouridine synthase